MTIDDLPYLNVFSPEYAADPNSVIDPVRAVSPLARSERGVEILAYSDCEDLLRDTGLATGFIEMFEASGISEGPAVDAFKFGIVESEGADHTRLRKAVARYFTARKIESLRATAHDLVKLWLVESAEQGTIDFEAAIGRRLPASLFCMLIGAPLEDSGAMAEYSDGVTRIFQYDPKHRDFIDSRCAELGDYIRRLMGQRRAAPGDDLLSVLVAAQDSGQLTETEVVSMCMVLLGGSTDTTNAQMCMNTLALARHPEAWALLREHPEHVRAAVAEAVRYAPAMISDVRVARQAAEFAGRKMPQGTMMHANIAAANFDATIFQDPKRFDVLRDPGPGGLNFGRGRHFCLGRPLTIMAQEEVVRAMLELWSQFELTGEPGIWGSPFPLRAGVVPLKFELTEDWDRDLDPTTLRP